jgi:hypothetical protein
MAVMETNYDQEMMQLWSVIADLSDQLNQHRSLAASLHAQAGGIKVSLDYYCVIGLMFKNCFTYSLSQFTPRLALCYAGKQCDTLDS